MGGTRNIANRARVLVVAAAGATAVTALVAPVAAAEPGGECVRNGGGLITVDGGPPVPPVFGFDGLRLIGVDGGVANSCITNLGPGVVHITHPAGREPGSTQVSDSPLEMRLDGGLGNIAVTNLGTGAVTVTRTDVAPGPAPAAQPSGDLPQMELDAGHDGVFVTNIGTGAVTVTDWDPADGPLPDEVPGPPGMVVTDPITGNVYVTNLFGPSVTVVDRPGAVARVTEQPNPVTSIDYGTANVFVTNIGGGSVIVVRE